VLLRLFDYAKTYNSRVVGHPEIGRKSASLSGNASFLIFSAARPWNTDRKTEADENRAFKSEVPYLRQQALYLAAPALVGSPRSYRRPTVLLLVQVAMGDGQRVIHK